MLITRSEAIRHVVFLLFALTAAVMMYEPLAGLFASKLKRDYHTLIPAIPIISLYLVYLMRMDILKVAERCFRAGLPIVAVGVAFYSLGLYFGTGLNRNDYATVMTSSAWVAVLGGFISAYGLPAFKIALFPLLFLILMVPLPSFVMEKIITFLQVGSTEFTNLLLMASGAPYAREGFVFHLPDISVEVAPQCSGIRSGLALFITALLAAHLFLKNWWKKVILVLCVLPITMFKNGIRIVTLTLLGAYVDPRILQSDLHREGGIPFFVVALFLMAPVLYFLRKSEGKSETRPFSDVKFNKRER